MTRLEELAFASINKRDYGGDGRADANTLLSQDEIEEKLKREMEAIDDAKSIDVHIKRLKMNSETIKRAAKAAVMFLALSCVGLLSYRSYLETGNTDELVIAIIGWLLGLFFMWIFIAKKEEWLREKLDGFF